MSRRLATFYLADRYVGIDVSRVQEVLRYQEMTPVPLALDEVAGLINLRGQIVTALDLRRRIGLPAVDVGTRPANVVVRSDTGLVSLLVDGVGDVLEVEEDDFEGLPDTLQGSARELIRGAFKLDNAILLELDLDAVVASGDRMTS